MVADALYDFCSAGELVINRERPGKLARLFGSGKSDPITAALDKTIKQKPKVLCDDLIAAAERDYAAEHATTGAGWSKTMATALDKEWSMVAARSEDFRNTFRIEGPSEALMALSPAGSGLDQTADRSGTGR